MLPQAFALQVAHPVIDAGVGQHSTYRTDPWGRMQRSFELLWPVVYARPDAAIRQGHELRELHRRIKGTTESGQRYQALNPEPYGWVHGTGYYTTLTMLDMFGESVDAAMRAQLFREWQQLGPLLGIRKQDMPASEGEYWEYFNDMIEHRLQWGPVLADLLSPDFLYQQPPPDQALLRRLPTPLWRALLAPAAWSTELITRATLPDNFRRRFDIAFDSRDRQRYARLLKVLRTGYRLTPASRRYIPLARDAWRDVRMHPQAYGVASADKGAALAS